MSRSERMCRTLPSWMLRRILSWPSWRNWWTAAWLELHQREVLDVVAASANDEDGPWPCDFPTGMH